MIQYYMARCPARGWKESQQFADAEALKDNIKAIGAPALACPACSRLGETGRGRGRMREAKQEAGHGVGDAMARQQTIGPLEARRRGNLPPDQAPELHPPPTCAQRPRPRRGGRPAICSRRRVRSAQLLSDCTDGPILPPAQPKGPHVDALRCPGPSSPRRGSGSRALTTRWMAAARSRSAYEPANVGGRHACLYDSVFAGPNRASREDGRAAGPHMSPCRARGRPRRRRYRARDYRFDEPRVLDAFAHRGSAERCR